MKYGKVLFNILTINDIYLVNIILTGLSLVKLQSCSYLTRSLLLSITHTCFSLQNQAVCSSKVLGNFACHSRNRKSRRIACNKKKIHLKSILGASRKCGGRKTPQCLWTPPLEGAAERGKRMQN